MSESRDAEPAAPRRVILAAAGVVLVVLVGAVVWVASMVVSDAWGRSQIDLVERFTSGDPAPDWPYLDAVDRTAAVCGSQLRCVQAVGNEYLTLLKFSNVDDARRHASTLGSDGVQIDPLVIDFDGLPLSPAVRQEIVEGVSGVNASSPD